MAAQFWERVFAGLETSPTFPTSDYKPAISTAVNHVADYIDCDSHSLSTKLQAAWALLLSQYANTNDVVFGVSVDHLQAQSTELGDCTKPGHVIPLRVPVDWHANLAEWLQSTQASAAAMRDSYPEGGLGQTQTYSMQAKTACEFRTLLVVRDGSEGEQRQPPLI
ncbi:hypothetical protein BDV06DRAFT_221694 [Aspergillus oleicola]